MRFMHEGAVYPKIDLQSLPGSFDPLHGLLSTQVERPKHLNDVDLRKLQPVQRALLVIDGTVTKFLEAYFLEPVEAALVEQKNQALSDNHAWLEVAKGTDIVARQVILRGRYSSTVYAYAISLLVPNRLPDSMLKHLEVEPSGIGHVLLNSQMENRRDILWYGHEHIENLPEEIQRFTGSEFISRAYRIIANNLPVMLINEKFPTQCFK
ncbi:chorismate--pyruvate lyase family protein [Candidatus Entotheonella palauensis]|uniref:chorismate--pyruvate lyase family protein n=1 Tax=Candidatus Entotheonella palauensis TaxID=93172 RepID=UPI000B7D3FE7|nr:chorismate pyruvate-lyase family protein [Candidatus Entotheonella palauensis]